MYVSKTVGKDKVFFSCFIHHHFHYDNQLVLEKKLVELDKLHIWNDLMFATRWNENKLRAHCLTCDTSTINISPFQSFFAIKIFKQKSEPRKCRWCIVNNQNDKMRQNKRILGRALQFKGDNLSDTRIFQCRNKYS